MRENVFIVSQMPSNVQLRILLVFLKFYFSLWAAGKKNIAKQLRRVVLFFLVCFENYEFFASKLKYLVNLT